MKPIEVIQKIRNKYTGEKLARNTEWEEVVRNNHEVLTGSLELLSAQLYKDDFHFVMELIQNADDNSYLDGKIPTIEFFIDNDKILIQNNEIGFNAKHAEAVCKVNSSSKANKREEGYIGEKGIGFKSVFSITNEPRIYSNGYQFKFKRPQKDSEDKLGYVLPEWISTIPDYVNASLTNIVLPLKEKLSEKKRAEFEDINAFTLLFLRRLKKIKITNSIDGKTTLLEKSIIRNDNKTIGGKHILCQTIEIKQIITLKGETPEKKSNRYIIIKESKIQVPTELNEDLRKGIQHTEVALGFQIDENGGIVSKADEYACAFLPIDKYGFRFLIQADFLLASARSEIREDKEWNIWLRGEILKVFIKAVTYFKSNPKYKHKFLEYIPRAKEVSNTFFLELSKGILDYCRKNEVLCSNNTSYSDWQVPSKLLYADKEVRELFPSSIVQRKLSLYYVSNETKYSNFLLRYVGAKEFDFNRVSTILDDSNWLGQQKNEWLKKLYSYLDGKTYYYKEEIKKLSILKLKNGVLTNIAESPIFYPLNSSKQYAFEGEIRVLHNDIASFYLGYKIESFYKDIGIIKAEPINIIENYIFSQFSGNMNNVSNEVFYDCILYIKHHYESLGHWDKSKFENKLKEIGKKIKLKIKDKNIFKFPAEIYLTKAYGNNYNIEQLFGGKIGAFFLDNDYLSRDKKFNSYSHNNNWLTFLRLLGVRRFPSAENKTQLNHISFVLNENNTGKVGLLIDMLSKEWKAHYRPYIRYFRNDEWFKLLKTKAIFRVGGKFYTANQLYKKTDVIKTALGENVPYIDASFKDRNEFIEDIGVNTVISVESLIKQIQLMKESKQENRAKCQFIYNLISERFDEKSGDIKNKFTTENLIFNPKTKKWCKQHEVIWSDSSDSFSEYRFIAQDSYYSVKKFFLEQLAISEKPDAIDYGSLLRDIITGGITDYKDRTVEKIYIALNKYLDPELEDNILQEKWWQDLKKKNLLLVKGKGFCKIDDKVYVNDHQELYDLFKQSESLSFLSVERYNITRLKDFIREMKISSLSEEVKVQLNECETQQIYKDLTDKLKERIFYIYRYIYHHNYTGFNRLISQGKLSQLQNLKVLSVDKIVVNYILNTVIKQKETNILLHENHIYVQETIQEKMIIPYISMELSRFLDNFRGLDDFIQNILYTPIDALYWLIEQKGISELPDEIWKKIFPEKTEVEQTQKIVQTETITKNGEEKVNTEKKESESNKKQIVEPPKYAQSNFDNNEPNKKWEAEYEPEESNSDGIQTYEGEVKPQITFSANQSNGRGYSGSNPYSKDAKVEIGTWGEKKVFLEQVEKLKIQYSDFSENFDDLNDHTFVILGKDGSEFVRLEWMNSNFDVQAGFDIKLIIEDNIYYYEIKSTTTDYINEFDISKTQWELMMKAKSNFSIFRVKNAGKVKVEITEIINPYQQWLEGKIIGYPSKLKI